MSDEEKKAIDYLKDDVVYWLDKGKDFVVIDIGENEKLHNILNLIDKQKNEIEEKSTIIMAGAEKVKQLEKEIKELKEKIVDLETKLEVEKIDNKYNQEERDEETIPRYKIREKIKELENKNEENKIELAKGIDMLSSNIIEKATNNIAINISLRDILEELLEEN